MKLESIHRFKIHWKFPMPLNSPIPWTRKMKQHREWWLNPQKVMCGDFLHPRDHDILIFTKASKAGWGAHFRQNTTGDLWSNMEKQLHINILELKAVIVDLQHFLTQCNTVRHKTTHRMVSVPSDFQTNHSTLGTPENRLVCNQSKLPTYVSPIPDPQTWAVDALNISWKNIVGYAFTPTALLPRMVQKLLPQPCRLILIAQGWPTKLWFWDLDH